MKTAPRTRRIEAAGGLAHALFHDSVEDHERGEIIRAMVLLLDDPEPAVRRALAEGLASYGDVPKIILTALLNDQTSIALPLIERSPALDQADMVTIIHNGEAATSAALAARTDLKPDIVSAIARSGTREAVLAMLANTAVAPSEVDLADIAERFGNDGDIRGCLLERADLSGIQRQILVSRVSEDLSHLVAERAWMTPERSARVLREAEDRAAVEVARAIDSRDLRKYIATLKDKGRITPALLIRALADGPQGLFEVAIAELANLPVKRVAEIVACGKPSTVTALLGKAGLSPRLQGAFADAVRGRREDLIAAGGVHSPYAGARMMERLLTACDSELGGEIDDLIALLRRMAVEAAREGNRRLGLEPDESRLPGEDAKADPTAGSSIDSTIGSTIGSGIDSTIDSGPVVLPAAPTPVPMIGPGRKVFEKRPSIVLEGEFFSEPEEMVQWAIGAVSRWPDRRPGLFERLRGRG